jgi:triacylglycerol esterase/lipase EstA (alpha/beta hydrolase family)
MMKNRMRAALLGAIILMAFAAPCAAGNQLVRESGKDPVVLVHGYAGSVLGQLSVEGYWLYYTTRFAIDGYDAYKIALPDAALADVRESADKLKNFVNDVRARTGRSKVDIVCHSEGGLVARYYIQMLGGAQFVDDMVTIATPHRGTTVAHIGPGKASRQMEVYNDFLNELNRVNTFPAGIDYTAIHSNHDEIVFPSQNGFWEGAVNINVNLLGHAGIMANEHVYQSVKGAISTDISGGMSRLPVQIQRPSMTTNSNAVTLAINPFNHHHTGEDMRQMRISNCPFMSGSDWESVSGSRSWSLDGGEGLKAVYVQFRHSGNWLFPKESPVYADYIFVDKSAPEGAVNIIPDSTISARVDIEITAKDNSDNYKEFKIWNALIAFGIEDLGVKEMMVSANSDFSGAQWVPLASRTSVDLAPGSGPRGVFVKFRDGAGNVSRVYSDTVNKIDPVADGLAMVDEDIRNPVVFVHGYMGSIVGDVSTYINWVYYIEKLKREGFSTHRITLSDAGLQDVTKSAAELDAFINGVLSETGAAKVDIVCHSEGGLVARYYLQNLGGAGKVDDLVTISTPHRGTTVAAIGPGMAARQMEVASDFLKQLNSGNTLPAGVEFTALFSNGDEIVVPGKNGFFDGAMNVNWNIFGHAGILFAPEPYNVVKAAISKKNIAAAPRAVEIALPGMAAASTQWPLKLTGYNHFDPDKRQTQMMISTNPLFAGASWQPFSESASVSVSGEQDGLIGVHVKFRRDGGAESPSYADYMVLDRTAPQGALAAESVDETTNTASLKISVTDNSDEYGAAKWTNLLRAYGILNIGAAAMIVSESPDFSGAKWEAIASSKTLQLSPGPGNKTIYAKFRDRAGNESAAVSTEINIFDGVNGYMALEQTKNPVVFVHGYGGSIVGDISAYINWVFFYEKLKADGYSVHRITISDGAMQDITISARELFDFVMDVRSKTGANRVDLVCHSEGGLIARYFIQNMGGASLVDDLVAISTPHRGTSTSHIGPGMAARQMEIASQFLQTLNAADTTPGGVDYTAIFTNDDITVTPAENAFFDGALNINTNGYNHATILFSDEVYKWVKSAVSLDIGHSLSQLPVRIARQSMVTASPQVSLSLNYYNHNDPQSAPAQMMLSNDKLFRGASWQPVSGSQSWTLDDGRDGLKAVYVKYKSESGAESPAYVDFVVLDRTAPEASVMMQQAADGAVEVFVSASDNTQVYEQLSLAHLLKSYGITGIGVNEMLVSASAGFEGAQWQPFAEKISWTFPAGADKKLYIKVRDAAGNESKAYTAGIETVADTAREITDLAVDFLLQMDSGWTFVYLPPVLPEEIRTALAAATRQRERRAYDFKERMFRDVSEAWQAAGGSAFWVHLDRPLQQAVQFTVSGAGVARAASSRIALEPGWNVVGLPGYESMSPDSLTIVHGAESLSLARAGEMGVALGKLFEFKDGSYVEVREMQPFRAYFMRAYQPCFLQFP